MEDTCLFCGADISDLGGHICKICEDKGNEYAESYYKSMLQDVEIKRDKCTKEYEQLSPIFFIRRKYLYKIIQLYTALIVEYEYNLNKSKMRGNEL